MATYNGGEYCTSCDLSFGKKRFKVHKREVRHLENEQKQAELSSDRRKNPCVREKTLPTFQPPSSPTSLEHHILSFVSQIRYKPEETHTIQLDILKDLKKALDGTFGKCECSFFGSMTVGLAFIGSDLDIYVDVDSFEYNKKYLNEKHENKSKVFRCANTLYRDEKFTDIEPVFEAKVPIVKMVHVPSKISCDVSFSRMGVESSRLVKLYLGRHRRFLDVMMLIKYWAKRNHICSGQKSISSYSWTLLFISYLQTLKLPNGEALVPSLLEVQRTSVLPEFIDGFRVDCKLPNASSSLSLPDDPRFSHRGLLEGFFRYYNHFEFGLSIVSPFLGQPIQFAVDSAQKRSRSLDPESLAFARCYDALKKQAKDVKTVEIIQDPFVHGNLMPCSISMLRIVKSCLAKAANICEKEKGYSLLEKLFLVTSPSRSRSKMKKPEKSSTQPSEPIPRQAVFHGEVCEDGFFVPIKNISFHKAVDAVQDILSKVMMFDVARFQNVLQENECSSQQNGIPSEKLLCVPLCPVPWVWQKKPGLNSLVPKLHSKNVQEFRKEYFRTLRRNYTSRPSHIRRFMCEITKKTATVLKITFKPCFVDSSGFSLHVMNFLRTSLENWISTVSSNM